MLMIYDITKFSMLDYPDELACIIWFAGCNMRCKYCHNPQIVTSKGKYTKEEIKEFLLKRKGVLTSVVFSGGEATLNKDLIDFAKEIKSMGFKLKLDTNGTNPRMIEQLIEDNLVDYIALDYKAPQKKFTEITMNRNWEKFDHSLDIVIKNQEKIKLEVRTTWHTALLENSDIEEILTDLNSRGYQGTIYLQNCNQVEDNNSFAELPVSENISGKKFIKKQVDIKIR